jgi:hypothetical protein
MSDDFQGLVAKLWASLGLPAPVFRTKNRIVLNIDRIAVELAESPDGGHMILTARAGRLSAEDPMRRAEQVQYILYSNLGSLTSHHACVSVDPKGAESPTVLVQGICSYETAGVAELTSVVQDVVALAEAHAAELTGERSRATGRTPASNQQGLGDTVIFRP